MYISRVDWVLIGSIQNNMVELLIEICFWIILFYDFYICYMHKKSNGNLKCFFRYFKLSFISFSILTVPEAKEMKKKINLWSHKIKTQDRIMEHRKIYIWLQANHLKPRIHFAQCQNAIQMTMMTSSLKRIAQTTQQQIKKFPGRTSTSQSIN